MDANFDFRSDTPPGKDPDKYSATLRSYHKQLWSKPLPSGEMFDLRDDVSEYLLHQSSLRSSLLVAIHSPRHCN